MGTAIAFSSATEALEVARAGLRFVATVDATAMTGAERAACLRSLEKADAAATAARTSVLGSFGAGQDYADDGDYSARSWLEHRTQITRGAAVDHTGWVKRAAAHPAVQAALADEAISKSYAREICRWTGSMPEDARAAADEILLGAAAAGLGLADLAGLAAEMYEKSRQDRPDGDGDENSGDGFDDRAVQLATTVGGAGVIHGDLTPECAEFVQTVLDALSAPAGAGDDRTHEQRYHDALQEAMRRLLAAGLLPGTLRAAGEGVGPYLAGGPNADRGQFRATGGMDLGTAGPVGRAPRRRRGGGRAPGPVAGRRRRRSDRLRCRHHSRGDRGGEPGRVR
jgi:hypothetical protein